MQLKKQKKLEAAKAFNDLTFLYVDNLEKYYLKLDSLTNIILQDASSSRALLVQSYNISNYNVNIDKLEAAICTSADEAFWHFYSHDKKIKNRSFFFKRIIKNKSKAKELINRHPHIIDEVIKDTDWSDIICCYQNKRYINLFSKVSQQQINVATKQVNKIFNKKMNNIDDVSTEMETIFISLSDNLMKRFKEQLNELIIKQIIQ